jgi:nucleoside-diphosphate-sugar epimerase
MTVSIIGGSGFLGSRLAKRLVQRGCAVKILDKRKSAEFGGMWNRIDVRNRPEEKNEFPESATDSLCAPGKDDEAKKSQKMNSLLEALSGSDVVVNLAAEHRDDVTPASLYDEVNVDGSRNVCDACTKTGIHRIIFTSSVAVYGFALPGTDESGRINFFNDYGRTKFLAEEEYRAWQKSDEKNCAVIIRPTVIFGEGNRGNVYNLLHQIAKKKFPMVGSGKNRKSMNYVENVAAFIEYEIFREKNPGEHLYNYCDEPAFDMNHLVLECYRALGIKKTRLFHFPFWLAYAGGKIFDLASFVTKKKFAVSSIRVKKFCQNTYFAGTNIKHTDFSAPVPLEEGLRRTIEFEFGK